jgi:hypothetical protein
MTEAGRALVGELGESPLSGARYALSVVALRLAAIEAEARAQGYEQAKADAIAAVTLRASSTMTGGAFYRTDGDALIQVVDVQPVLGDLADLKP